MTAFPGHCLIINSYSYRNAGDAAIMLATKHLLESQGALSVTLSSRYDDGDEYAAHGLKVVPEIVPFPAEGSRLRRLALVLYGVTASLIIIAVRALGRRAARNLAKILLPGSFRLMEDTDTVVIAGGGYMYSSKRRLNVSLYQSLISVRLGRAVVGSTLMMPQSIGPVTRDLDRRLIEWSLKETIPVVREQLSLAASTHRPRLAVTEIDDVAFYRERTTEEMSSSRYCRMVVMDWRWSSSSNHDAFTRYIRAIAEIAEGAHALGLQVVLGGHSSLPEHKQDDLVVAREVSAILAIPHRVDEDTNVSHLYEEYAQSRVIIGTRLHACIMAISVGTPAISLQYQEKSRGVLQRLGLGRFVHRVDALDPALIVSQLRELIEVEERWGDIADRTRTRIARSYEEIYR